MSRASVALLRTHHERVHADYRHRIPDATDVALLVEVSAKNVTADRQQRDLYGRSGIPVYWFVNLADLRVEVYTNPGRSGYASERTSRPVSKSPCRSTEAKSARSPSIPSCREHTQSSSASELSPQCGRR